MLTLPEGWPSRPADDENWLKETVRYGSVFLLYDPHAKRAFRILSQDDYDIVVMPKGFAVHPKLPNEVVPHG